MFSLFFQKVLKKNILLCKVADNFQTGWYWTTSTGRGHRDLECNQLWRALSRGWGETWTPSPFKRGEGFVACCDVLQQKIIWTIAFYVECVSIVSTYGFNHVSETFTFEDISFHKWTSAFSKKQASTIFHLWWNFYIYILWTSPLKISNLFLKRLSNGGTGGARRAAGQTSASRGVPGLDPQNAHGKKWRLSQ